MLEADNNHNTCMYREQRALDMRTIIMKKQEEQLVTYYGKYVIKHVIKHAKHRIVFHNYNSFQLVPFVLSLGYEKYINLFCYNVDI